MSHKPQYTIGPDLARQGYSLCAAQEAHAPAVAGLMERYFAELKLQHDPSNLDRDLVSPLDGYESGGLILLIMGQTPVGCVGVRRLKPGVAELKRMYLHPDHRGGGLGKALLGAALQLARNLGFKSMMLDTRLDLKSANRLYEKCGFQDIGDYNQNPRAERFMALDL